MLTRKKKADMEQRGFQEMWRYQYFFTKVNEKQICLICKQQVVTQEPYLRRHYNVNHAVMYNEYSGEARKEKIRLLELSLNKQQLLLENVHKESDGAIRAGYMIAHTMALSGKPFHYGTFIKKCMLVTTGVICPDKRQEFADINLSVNVIERRIRDLAKSLDQQLEEKVKTFIAFSLSVAEYSANGNEGLHLAVFIRGVDKDLEVTEEFVDLVPVKEMIAAEICGRLMRALDKLGMDWAGAVSLARDRAPSLMNAEVVMKLENALLALNSDNCFYDLHSIWYPEVLYTKVLKLNNVLDGIVKTFRLFRSMQPNLSIVWHPIDVSRVCKGGILKRFHGMCDEMDMCLKGEEIQVPELKDIEWRQDLAFLVDVKDHLDDLKAKVMGSEKLVTDLYDSICAFEVKLQLFEKQLLENDLTHFPTLQSRRVTDTQDSFPYDIHNEKCSIKILELRKEFQNRINSFKKFKKSFAIFLNPFSCSPHEAPEDLQLELIELQCDLALKNKFSSIDIRMFYKYLGPSYSKLKSLASEILSMFGSMNVSKKLFKVWKGNGCGYLFRLGNKCQKSVLKIATAQALSPDFDTLVQMWKLRQVGALHRNEETLVSRSTAESANHSVTNPVESGHENIPGRNQEGIGIKHSRNKEARTDQSSSGVECVTDSTPEVYIDVAEYSEDPRKRKHSEDDCKEFSSVGDGRKYFKSEDDIDEKIDISEEWMFVESNQEQDIMKGRSRGAYLDDVKHEPDFDGILLMKEEHD